MVLCLLENRLEGFRLSGGGWHDPSGGYLRPKPVS